MPAPEGQLWCLVPSSALVPRVHTGSGPALPTPQAARLAPARRWPTWKLSVTLKTTLSRTQQLPRSPILSLTSCLVELVT